MARGVPVTINGRTGGTPGPATTTAQGFTIPSLAPGKTIARQITIQNLDATNDLLLYLPKGGNYLTLAPGASLVQEALFNSFAVQASAATVDWEAILLVG